MRTTTLVIGAGHAGLAMSRCLADRSIDHVVLERGEVANSWKTERWDSLRLLTPNWQSRLPSFEYRGDDPDGYRTMPQTIDFIERYADSIAAPVHSNTAVESIRPNGDGYVVVTNQGEWHARTVVLATVPRIHHHRVEAIGQNALGPGQVAAGRPVGLEPRAPAIAEERVREHRVGGSRRARHWPRESTDRPPVAGLPRVRSPRRGNRDALHLAAGSAGLAQ